MHIHSHTVDIHLHTYTCLPVHAIPLDLHRHLRACTNIPMSTGVGLYINIQSGNPRTALFQEFSR